MRKIADVIDDNADLFKNAWTAFFYINKING